MLSQEYTKISIVYEEYLYHKIKQNTIKIGELVMISLQFNRLSKLRRRNCTYTIANKILIDIFCKIHLQTHAFLFKRRRLLETCIPCPVRWIVRICDKKELIDNIL